MVSEAKDFMKNILPKDADELLKSRLHMFQQEATRIDYRISMFLEAQDDNHRGNLEPNLRLAYHEIKNLFAHIWPLMSINKRADYVRKFDDWDKIFYNLNRRIEENDASYMDLYGGALVRELDILFREFIMMRQEVGMGVSAGRPAKWAAGSKHLKPEQQDDD
jgi:hypothetical protein